MKRYFAVAVVIGLMLAFTSACQRQTKPDASGEGADALQRIHFDFDKSAVRPDAAPILEQNAGWIKGHSSARVVVEGHCDERGTNEYNMALGDRRARSARDYLANLGVDPSVLSVVSYGEERPLDPASNESAWALNRRAEFVAQ